jgi:hypothetical protein
MNGLLNEPPRIIADRASEECGCPEREFIYRGVDVLIHFEGNGSSEAHFDTGDWTMMHVDLPPATSIDKLQAHAMAWIDQQPSEQ